MTGGQVPRERLVAIQRTRPRYIPVYLERQDRQTDRQPGFKILYGATARRERGKHSPTRIRMLDLLMPAEEPAYARSTSATEEPHFPCWAARAFAFSVPTRRQISSPGPTCSSSAVANKNSSVIRINDVYISTSYICIRTYGMHDKYQGTAETARVPNVTAVFFCRRS